MYSLDQELAFATQKVREQRAVIATLQSELAAAKKDLEVQKNALMVEAKERDEAKAEIARARKAAHQARSFQDRVQPWMTACFGEMISGDREERNHRFLEESLELVQACGCTAEEAHQLVDYVFGRAVGDPPQEVGGVMVTLAALCLANELNMHQCGEIELARIWTKVDVIRAKQAAKPKYGPLPQAVIEIAHTGEEG